MAAQNPPVNGVAYSVYIALQSLATPGAYQANPTLAAGDVKVSKDGGAFASLTTLPSVAPAAGIAVLVALSAAEMTADNVFVQFIDQTATKEWADYAFNIQTVAAGWATAANVSAVETDTQDIQARLPAALVSGRMDSNIQAAANDVITAAALAADAVTEIQTGLATAASIAALNNLSSAQAQTAAAAALTAYDPPTHAELVSEIDAAQADIAALSIPTANENADALLDRVDAVETGLTPRGALRLQAAALAGELSGAATTTVTIRNAVADSKDRITATVDSDGNRTAVVTDVS